MSQSIYRTIHRHRKQLSRMSERFLNIRIALIFTGAGFLSLWSESAGFWSLNLANRSWLPYSLFFTAAVSLIYPGLKENARIRHRSLQLKEWLGRFHWVGSGAGIYRSLFLYLFIFLASFTVFWNLRMQYFRHPPLGMGDSLHLLDHVPVFAHFFGYLSSIDEILSLWLYSAFYLLLQSLSPYADVRHSYWILSSFAGAAYAVTAFYAARIAYKKMSAVLKKNTFFYAAASLLFFTPAIQIYAGYIENYIFTVYLISVITTASAVYLDSAEFSIRKSQLFLLFTGFLSGLAASFHLVAGFLAPALILLVWILTSEAGSDFRSRSRLFLKLSLPAAAAGTAVLASVYLTFLFLVPAPVDPGESFAFRPALYPFRKLISITHLMQFLNLMIIASPGFIFLFLLNIRTPLRFFAKLSPRNHGDYFILTAAASLLFHSFIWNPMIGFPADWDLFSLWWFPLNYYLLRRLPDLLLLPHRSVQEADPQGTITAFMSLFSSLIAFSWVHSHSLSDPESIKNFKDSQVRTEIVSEYFGYSAAERKFSEKSLIHRIPTVARRKLFVKAKLFEIRASFEISDYLNAHPESTDSLHLRELSDQLADALIRLAEIMQKEENEYRKEFPLLWRELTEINKSITEILHKN